MRLRTVAAASVTLLMMAACDDASEPVEPVEPVARAGGETTIEEPEAPDGMRLVGLGRVVVAVPESWVNVAPCETARTGFVSFENAPCREASEDLAESPAVAGLHIATARSRSVIVGSLPTGRSVGGVKVLDAGFVCRDSLPPLCGRVFAAPSENVVFLTTGDESDAGQLSQIRDSLQLLPEGFTAVPFIEFGTSVDDGRGKLADAGLSGESPDVNFPHYVTGTVPAAGSVVRVGDAVEMTIGDG